jgi:hypothetical protein
MAETILFRAIRQTNDGVVLKGVSPVDEELLNALPRDRDGKMEVTFPRNLQFHKKFFALLGVVYDYMDDDTRKHLNVWSVGELLQRLKIDLGLYTLHIVGEGSTLPAGTPVYMPDSISFGRMDDVAFSRLYKNTIGVAIGKYVTNQTEASMMAAVDAVLRFE